MIEYLSLAVRGPHLPDLSGTRSATLTAATLAREYGADPMDIRAATAGTPKALLDWFSGRRPLRGGSLLILHISSFVSVFERDGAQICAVALRDSVQGRPSSMVELPLLLDHVRRWCEPAHLVVLLELRPLSTSQGKPSPESGVVGELVASSPRSDSVTVIAAIDQPWREDSNGRQPSLDTVVSNVLARSALAGVGVTVADLVDQVAARGAKGCVMRAGHKSKDVFIGDRAATAGTRRLPEYICDDLYCEDAGSRLDAAMELADLARSGSALAVELIDGLASSDPSSEVRAYATAVALASAKPTFATLVDFGLVPGESVRRAAALDLLPWLSAWVGGVGVMGVDPPSGQWFENPRHAVEVEPFRLAVHAVTNLEYLRYVAGVGAVCPGGWVSEWIFLEEEDLPVTMVSWYEAMGYCRWLTAAARRAGRLLQDEYFTLPTEAQWELAARNFRGDLHPWGDDFAPDKCNVRASRLGRVRPVGAGGGVDVNDMGCQGLIGNVWEWTASLWGPSGRQPSFLFPYSAADGREDPDASGAVRRIVRGGAYYYATECANSFTRNRALPTDRHPAGGFRVAMRRAVGSGQA